MELSTAWRATLGELEVSLSKANFTTWFRETEILEVADQAAVIGVPNGFTKEWLENKYRGEIEKALAKRLPEVAQVHFKIVGQAPPQLLIEEEAEEAEAPQKDFNQHYTFENFIVGNSNRLAHAVAQAVVQKPGRLHNPLVIYGGVGLGKTHLIHAIGNAVVARFPKKKVLYVPCEQFTTAFVSAIHTGKIGEFKKTHREVEVLLVDDIQFLSGKEGTQEEFFHTFNALHEKDRQIVLTADRMPKAIPAITERLSSRFGAGMVADIQPPNLETRLAILRAKAAEREFEAPPEVLLFIAQRIASNIRDLEGALNRLAAHYQLYRESPTPEVAGRVLEDLIASAKIRNLTVDKVFKVVTEFFGISKEELLSPRRNKELVYPRQLTMYLMRHELSLSYPKISRELGKRDHTTVIHACVKISRVAARQEKIQEDISALKERLYLV